jgi:hypothetical protein
MPPRYWAPMRVRATFFFFVYIAAVNLPFWIASYSMGFVLKGLFNVELLAIGVLSLFVRRAATVSLLLIAMLLDMLRGVNSTYLMSPFEMVRSARFLFEYAPSHVGYLVMVAACMALVCFLAVRAQESRPVGWERVLIASTLVIFLVVIVGIDTYTGHVSFGRLDRQLGTLRLTRSPGYSLVKSQRQYEGFNHIRFAGTDASVPAASKMMVRFDGATLSLRANSQRTDSQRANSQEMKGPVPNVVLILVESWGKSLDVDLEEALVRPYSDERLSEKYAVSRGTVPFYGPTVAGEARELCGSSMGFGLLTASAAKLKGCLPETMKAMGYHSTAVHGYSARMFDRGEWYRRIGFDETWFRDQLLGQGLPMCPGPFPGTCDAAVSSWIGDRLQENSDTPQFVYWVTLNSHLPVPVSNGVKAPPSCSDHSATAEAPAVCAWYQLVFNVHRAVAELALRPATRPTIFLIVGDHAPPFASALSRSEFSDRVVPYVLLTPKRGEVTVDRTAMSSLAGTGRPPAAARRPHPKKGTALSSAAAGS